MSCLDLFLPSFVTWMILASTWMKCFVHRRSCILTLFFEFYAHLFRKGCSWQSESLPEVCLIYNIVMMIKEEHATTIISHKNSITSFTNHLIGGIPPPPLNIIIYMIRGYLKMLVPHHLNPLPREKDISRLCHVLCDEANSRLYHILYSS